MTITLNLSIDQGADFTQAFAVPGVGTSHDAALQLRPWLSRNSSPVVVLTTSNGGLVATSGLVTASIPSSITALMAAELYVYDLRVIAPEGIVSREYQGSAFINYEVTTIGQATPSNEPSVLLVGGGYLRLISGGKTLLLGNQ